MAVSVFYTELQHNDATDGFFFNKPMGLADGDIIYFWCNKDDDIGGDWLCSGFTNLSNLETTSGNDINSGLLRKVITDASSEPSDYYVESGDSDSMTVTLAVIRGGDTTTPEDGVAIQHAADNNTTTPTAPSITTNTAGALILTGVCGDDGGTTITYTVPSGTDPATYTLHKSEANGTGSSSGFASGGPRTAAGATGDVIWNGGDGTNENHVILWAVKPAYAGPAGDLDTTLGAVTSSSDGDLEVKAEASNTFLEASSSSEGGVFVAGTLSKTLGLAELDSDGSVISGAEGDLDVTLSDLTVLAGGDTLIVGTLSTSLEAAVAFSDGATEVISDTDFSFEGMALAAESVVTAAGFLSKSTDNMLADSEGVIEVSAEGAVSLAALALASESVTLASGSLSTNLEPSALSSEGSIGILSDLSSTQAEASLSADGSALSGAVGNVTVTFEDLAGTANGSVDIVSTSFAQLLDVTSTADGSVGVQGELISFASNATLSADGSIKMSADADFTLSSIDLNSEGSAISGVVGNTDVTLGPLSVTATGGVEVGTLAAVSLADLVSAAAGEVKVQGSVPLALDGLELAAEGSSISGRIGNANIALSDLILLADGVLDVGGEAGAILADSVVEADGSIGVQSELVAALGEAWLGSFGSVTISGEVVCIRYGVSFDNYMYGVNVTSDPYGIDVTIELLGITNDC